MILRASRDTARWCRCWSPDNGAVFASISAVNRRSTDLQQAKEHNMTQRRWVVLIAVLGLMPMLLAMRPVDDALLKAAFKGDLSEVNALIKKEADINAANTGGFTPLLVAAEKGHREIMALLVDKGADVNQATTEGATHSSSQPRRGIGRS